MQLLLNVPQRNLVFVIYSVNILLSFPTKRLEMSMSCNLACFVSLTSTTSGFCFAYWSFRIAFTSTERETCPLNVGSQWGLTDIPLPCKPVCGFSLSGGADSRRHGNQLSEKDLKFISRRMTESSMLCCRQNLDLRSSRKSGWNITYGSGKLETQW